MDVNATEVRSNTPQIVPLEFYEDFEPDGKGGLSPVEFVKWQKKGVSTPAITIEKIDRLKPREAGNGRPSRPAAPEWAVLKPYYEAYKEGLEPPENGTPLPSWPGCPPGLAKALGQFQVRSVEDFVGMPDGQRDKINHPSVRMYVKQAEQFLKNKQLEHDVESVTADLRSENAELRKMVEGLQDALEQLKASKSEVIAPSDDATEEDADEKPKRRGRPPKKVD